MMRWTSRPGCDSSARITSASRTLLYLTAKDLKELGIVSVGHRRQLLEASADLRPSAKATDERISQFSRSDSTLILNRPPSVAS